MTSKRTVFSHSRWLLVAGLALMILPAGCDDDPTTTPAPDPFVFADDLPGAYTRVDRMGMPAIATALVTSKDAYNAGDPAGDAGFVGEFDAALTSLHTALDDDLMGLALTPCNAVPDCRDQAAPLIVPDTIKIDTMSAAGFPNGRLLTDPVIDVTLALALLDIAGGTHTATDLVGALNPDAHDTPYSATFPFLLAPNN